MDVDGIDHVNLHVPDDRIDDAVAFYEGVLGWEAETLDAYRADETSLLTFRMADDCVLHTLPVDPAAFDPPDDGGYDHCAVRVNRSFESLERTLEAHGVELDARGERRGATGVATAAYVYDPFGYRWELKAVGGDE